MRQPVATVEQNSGFMAAEKIWMVCLASLVIWTFLAVSSGVSMYAFDRSLGRTESLLKEFILPVVNGIIFACLTPIVFFLARRYPIQRNNWWARVGFYILGAFVFTIAHVGLRGLFYPVWDPRTNGFVSAVWNSATHTIDIQWVLLKRLFYYNMVDDIASTYTVIVLVANAVWYYKKFREREMRATQLETQLMKARLQVLTSQMQPHFLFNTMHSISALMHSDARSADRMMTLLSDLLRMSLENGGTQITSLRKELEFLSGYLAIEKIRFAERLTLSIDVDPNTLDAEVPHLLLQPLVENAVRHGISKRSAGGEIRIVSSRVDGMLHLQIMDDGPGFRDLGTGEDPKTGLGLRSTRERMQTLYGSRQTMEVQQRPGGGVEISLRLPFRESARLTDQEAVWDVRWPEPSQP
jgi:two-component system LytT family sensor kinase